MHRLLRPLSNLFGAPRFLQGFHGWMTLVWAAAIPLTIFTSLKSSLLWIGAMSSYALAIGHWSAWQASRAEVAIADGDPAVKAVDAEEAA